MLSYKRLNVFFFNYTESSWNFIHILEGMDVSFMWSKVLDETLENQGKTTGPGQATSTLLHALTWILNRDHSGDKHYPLRCPGPLPGV